LQGFVPQPPPGSPYQHLIVSFGSPSGPGFQLTQNDSLIGRLVVSSAADSATLVNYNQGLPIPKDSVSTANINVPDFGKFITNKLAGGYTPITAGQLTLATPLLPMDLGNGTNGVYYSPTDLFLPGGLSTSVKIYGTVYILVHGGVSWSDNLNLIPGNAS